MGHADLISKEKDMNLRIETNHSSLRILLFAANFGRVGDAMRAVATGKALALRGHHVTVMYSKPNRTWGYRVYEEDGVQIVESPRLVNPNRFNGFQNPFVIFANLFWLVTHSYDVYHAFVPVDNVGIPWLIWKMIDRKAIFLFDQSDLIVDGGFLGSNNDKRGLARLSYKLAAWTEKAVKLQADSFFVLSTRLEQRAHEQGVLPERIQLIRTGVLFNQVYTTLDKQEARRKIGLSDQILLLGFASIHLAGLDELLSGVTHLQKSGLDFKILFTGNVSDDIKLIIRNKSLEQYFIFTGWLDDKVFGNYLSSCDIFLTLMDDTPCSIYCFPSKLVNYMAVGRPMVVTDIGDAGDFIRQYGCGLVYPVGGENLARAIVYITLNPDEALLMGQRGRDAVMCDLSWEKLSKKIEGTYLNILENKNLLDHTGRK
ncbi:MAG: glycosyltransferase [Bacteroidetes bacterium]|nr:glycosyltransferase [Bacteroidota bacterium]